MTRQTRTFTVLAVAVVAASAATYGIYEAEQRRPVRQVEVPSAYVVVAAQAMPVGTQLTKDSVKLVPWPARSPLPDGFSSIDNVLDRGLVDGVVENEPILARKLAPIEAGAGLPPSIPPGMRAISVKVNEVVGVAGFVVPGTRVDVLAIVRQRDDSVSKIVVHNAQVLTAGTRYDQEQAVKKDAKPVQSTVVTLLVTPDDAQRVALAQTEGRVLLALRNPLDAELAETRAVGTAGLLGALPAAPAAGAPTVKKVAAKPVVPAPVPAVAPPPTEPKKPYTVEAIRAAKRTQEVVSAEVVR